MPRTNPNKNLMTLPGHPDRTHDECWAAQLRKEAYLESIETYIVVEPDERTGEVGDTRAVREQKDADRKVLHDAYREAETIMDAPVRVRRS